MFRMCSTEWGLKNWNGRIFERDRSVKILHGLLTSELEPLLPAMSLFVYRKSRTIFMVLYLWNLTYNNKNCISQTGLLRLQQIYQSIKPEQESFKVDSVRKVQTTEDAISFLISIEVVDR